MGSCIVRGMPRQGCLHYYLGDDVNDRFLKDIKRLNIPQGMKDVISLDILSDSRGMIAREYADDLEPLIALSASASPFLMPDANIEGKLRFGIAENGIDAGINPEECR